jgi:hypothetical protein
MEAALLMCIFGFFCIALTTSVTITRWLGAFLCVCSIVALAGFVKYKPHEETINTIITTDVDKFHFSCPVKMKRIETTYPWSMKDPTYRFEVDCGSIHPE